MEPNENQNQIPNQTPNENENENNSTNQERPIIDTILIEIDPLTRVDYASMFLNLMTAHLESESNTIFRNEMTHPSQAENDRLLDDILNQSFNDTDYTYKQVISDEGKEELKHIKYSKSNTELNSTCPIEMIDFEEGDDIIMLDCNHCFTPAAINKWLEEEKAECPVCRFKLKSKEIRVPLLQQPPALPTTNWNSELFTHPFGPIRLLESILPHSYIHSSMFDMYSDDSDLAFLMSLI
jgi:hypothetical protein